MPILVSGGFEVEQLLGMSRGHKHVLKAASRMSLANGSGARVSAGVEAQLVHDTLRRFSTSRAGDNAMVWVSKITWCGRTTAWCGQAQ